MISKTLILILFSSICTVVISPHAYGVSLEVSDAEDNLVTFGGISDYKPFELGKWAFPLLVVNGILLGIGILNKKNKLPNQFKKSVKNILNFEISTKVTVIAISVLLTFYIGFSIEELYHEEGLGDYPSVKNQAEGFATRDATLFELHVRYFLLYLSLNVFGNIRIIPFLASIALLILTYLFTSDISKKRFAGIVAMGIVLQSHLFLEYDTYATRTNFWTLFFLLSLYLINKKWYISPIAYVLSFFSKALTAVFLPLTLFFIYQSNIPKRKKIQITSLYAIIISIGIVAILLSSTIPSLKWLPLADEFHYQESLTGFREFSSYLRFDQLVLLFILPLHIALFMASKKGILHANSLMVLIAGILLTAPLLTGFTDLTNQPYRFIPLVVFFAIGAGILLSKNMTPSTNHNKKNFLTWIVFLVTLPIVVMSLVSVIFPAIIPGYYRVVI